MSFNKPRRTDFPACTFYFSGSFEFSGVFFSITFRFCFESSSSSLFASSVAIVSFFCFPSFLVSSLNKPCLVIVPSCLELIFC